MPGQVQPTATLLARAGPARGEDQSFAGRVHDPGREMSESSRCRARDRRAGRLVRSPGTTGWHNRPSSQAYDAVWIAGGYPTDWNDATTVAKLGGTPLLIVQDLFASPLGGAGRLAVAGDGVCRAVRVVCESPGPAADVRVGDSTAARCDERRAPVVATAGPPVACTTRPRCCAKWPRRSSTFRLRLGSDSGRGCGSEVRQLA